MVEGYIRKESLTERGVSLQKRNYKGLFVTDLDGTLLNDHRQFSSNDLEALSRLREDGYLVVIATGRSNYSFEKHLVHLGYSSRERSLPVDYVIFSTGAGIMDFQDQNILQKSSLSCRDVQNIIEHLNLLKLDYMVHRPVPNTRFFLYHCFGSDNPDFHTRLSMYSDFAKVLSPESVAVCDGATEVLCIVPEKSGHQVAAQLAEIFKKFSVIKATSPLDHKSIWVEIFSPKVSKSQAVSWLADHLSISRENICAVGNDYNDEDLLRWATRKYVVANSPISLKSQFETVASNEENGVSEAVARWLTTMDVS